MIEKDYVGLSEASSAFNGDGKADILVAVESPARDYEEELDEEEELELGLSLGANRLTGGRSKAWGGCRILTARDFPAPLGSRASPLSSSSSVSSSDGANRVGEPDVAGSANPPSQVVVGWPPIRAFRINSLVNQAKDGISDPEAINNKKSSSTQCIKNTKNQGKKVETRFVKVNMDGDPIGRKVDLNAHRSYETLALALEVMFQKPTDHGMKASRFLDGSSDFALTYEDKDGDWMLVGDVPWGMFLDAVKRLRIMRTSDANAPRFQTSTGGLLRSKVA